jgi:hypothetical protein
MRITSVYIPVLLFTAAALCSAGTSAQAPAAPTASYKSDPKFVAAVADAKKLAADGQLNFAVDAYKKANKIAQANAAIVCVRS